MPKLEEWETLGDLEPWELLERETALEDDSPDEDTIYLGAFANAPVAIPDIDSVKFHQSPDPVHGKNGKTFKRIRSDARKRVVLKTYARTANLQEAANAAGLSTTSMIHYWKKNDPEFLRVWDELDVHIKDVIEGELLDRAMNGVVKQVWHKGEPVGEEVLKSDRLLLAAMKARDFRYRDSIAVESTTNVNVGIALMPTAARTAEEWQEQAKIIQDNQKPIDLRPTIVIDRVAKNDHIEKPTGRA